MRERPALLLASEHLTSRGGSESPLITRCNWKNPCPGEQPPWPRSPTFGCCASLESPVPATPRTS